MNKILLFILLVIMLSGCGSNAIVVKSDDRFEQMTPDRLLRKIRAEFRKVDRGMDLYGSNVECKKSLSKHVIFSDFVEYGVLEHYSIYGMFHGDRYPSPFYIPVSVVLYASSTSSQQKNQL